MILLEKDKNNRTCSIFHFYKESGKFIGLPAVILRHLSNIYCDRNEPIFNRTYKTAFSGVLNYITTHKRWNILNLKNVPCDSYFFKQGKHIFEKNGFKFEVLQGYQSPYIKKTAKWDDYLKERSKNFHKSLKNKLNRAKRDGIKIKYIEYSLPEEIEKAIEIAFDIDRNSWKHKKGTSLSANEKTKKYWRSLSKELAQNNMLKICILWFDNTPVAFEYHGLYNNTIYSMKWSYDERFSKYSPGLILKFNSMKSFWNDDFEEIDLLGTSDSFKEKWTKVKRNHYNIYIFNNNPYSLLLYILFKLRHSRLIKNTKNLLFRI